MLKRISWDEALARELLDKNREALQHLQKGLLCNRWDLPPMTLKNLSRGDRSRTYLYSLHKLGQLVAVEALYFFKKDNNLEGFRSVLKALRLGYMMEKSAGAWEEFILGITIQEFGLRVLQHPFEGQAWSVL